MAKQNLKDELPDEPPEDFILAIIFIALIGICWMLWSNNQPIVTQKGGENNESHNYQN